jgi:ubiquinone/menaquinone biosynthesis C-methylase UbiE
VEKASQNLPEGDIRVGDSENIPWENEKFDLVVCNSSFHHYPNPKRVLKEIRRVLKKDGKLIIGDPTAPGIIRSAVNLTCKVSPHGDYHVYNKREIKRLLRKTEFKLLNYKQIDEKHFAVTCTKK